MKHKNIFLLLLGRTISNLGSSIQMMIMPLYIIDIGRSASDIGMFSFLYLLPILLVFPIAGVIGDRLNRKKIIVVSDFVSGSVILFLAVLSARGHMSYGILVVGQMIVGGAYGFFDPASKGIVPCLVPKEALASTNSKMASLRILSSMIAPIIGAVLYALLDVTILFIVNGLSFILSAISELFIRYKHEADDTRINAKRIVANFVEGINFIKAKKTVLRLCLYLLVVITFIQPVYSIILPLLFKRYLSFSDMVYGYTQMAFVAGAFVGSVIIGLLSKKCTLLKLLLYGNKLLITSLMLFTVMLIPTIIHSLGNGGFAYFILLSFSLFLFSGSIMFVNIPVQTLIQSTTPSSHMSRVFSIVSLITKAGIPVGSLIFGLILEEISIHVMMIWAVIIAFIVLMIFSGSFRKGLIVT